MENQLKKKRALRRCATVGLFLVLLVSLFGAYPSHGRSAAFVTQARRSADVIVSQKSFVPHLLVRRWDKTFLEIYTWPNDDPPNPFLNVIPDPTGRELYVNIHGLSNTVGTLSVNAKDGPTARQYSYTATYSNTQNLYLATLTGFTPGVDSMVSLNLTSTTGLETPPQEYPRIYIPAAMARTIQIGNGRLELGIVNTDTFANETYLAFAPGFAPDRVVPAGHRILNQPYTINASGSITGTVRAMVLKFRYNPSELNGALPEALAIMQWQPVTQQWVRLPSSLYKERGEIVTTIRRFTTYALMLTPTWHDDFDDLSGLEIQWLQNVDLKLKDGFADLLALYSNATNGVATSKPITPPVAIQQWDQIFYGAVAAPPTTTLTIDILDSQGMILLSAVASGASLAAIDPILYPVLRLRATFTATVPGQSAELDEWRLSWKPAQEKTYHLYLPKVIR